MIVLGLTGGIAMGKTTVARQFAACGAEVCDADAIVHRIMDKNGEAVPAIQKHFPSAVKNEAVDRKALGKLVFSDAIKLKTLETILHPLVIAEENDFIHHHRTRGAKIVLLDIPLLFETMGDLRCDAVAAVTCSPIIQTARAMRRPGMTREKLDSIRARQWPDWKRRKHADYLVHTGIGKAHSLREVKMILHQMTLDSSHATR